VVVVRRLSWQLPAAVILLVLLAALATLQYRWLGEVGEAERERMRASLRTRASEFTQEFDAELTRTYTAFQIDGDRLDADPSGALAAAYAQWQASTTTPGLVRGVYVAEGRTFASAKLQRFDPDRGALETVAWPPALAGLMQRTPRMLPQVPGLPPPMLMADVVDAGVPALIVPAPHVTRSTVGDRTAVMTNPTADARVLIIGLDIDRLTHQLLEPLVAKYFGEGDASEYFVTVVRRDDPSAVVFSSTSAPVDTAGADVATGLFYLRMDEVTRLAGSRGAMHVPIAVNDHVAITIVRRANASYGKRVLMTGGDEQGAWEVRARHRSGSLEAIVARSRRRNFAISLGVLGLLAASLLLALASAQRQRRLARQQMEFVAAVSHELRTPLAVICSAGENLADGVVSDGTQVKRYGALIETEGRRLGDMVERVMAFAGISSGTAFRARADVDVSKVIAEVADAVRHDAQDRGVTVTVHSNGALSPVVGDADALRSAVQNIVGNAVKYSQSGGAVDISTHVQRTTTPRIEIRVADRGLGIDAADLPHIFKPFFRGRRAVDAQVRGTGVGLSVVKHVVDAHQGTISVDSRVGEGTTVVVELPVSTDARAGSPVAQPLRAANRAGEGDVAQPFRAANAAHPAGE
jgi:signal transduction histidine kinase